MSTIKTYRVIAEQQLKSCKTKFAKGVNQVGKNTTGRQCERNEEKRQTNVSVFKIIDMIHFRFVYALERIIMFIIITIAGFLTMKNDIQV